MNEFTIESDGRKVLEWEGNLYQPEEYVIAGSGEVYVIFENNEHDLYPHLNEDEFIILNTGIIA